MSDQPEVFRDRLSVLLAGAAVGFFLSRVIELPGRLFGVQALGTPVGIELNTYWLTTAFVIALVVTGTHSVLLSHPLCCQCRARSTFVNWILPALTALLIGRWLATFQNTETWLVAMAIGLIALGYVTTHEYKTVVPDFLARPSTQLAGACMVYALALGLLFMIQGTGARFLLSGPAVLVGCGLLAIRLHWQTGRRFRWLALNGGVVGLVMAQTVWVLGYCRLAVLPASLLLLLVFYLATGVVQMAVQERLGPRSALELGTTAFLAALIIVLL
jgi:hypothetical protein